MKMVGPSLNDPTLIYTRVGIGCWNGVGNNMELEKKNAGSQIQTMEMGWLLVGSLILSLFLEDGPTLTISIMFSSSSAI